MNRRVEKPKAKIALGSAGTVSDARTERFLRDNHAEIDAQLQRAKQAIDGGEAAPLESLPDLLKIARKAHKRRH